MKDKIEKCKHDFGYRVIGGFVGHEHTHTTGEQICLKCEKTYEELINQEKREAVDGLVMEIIRKIMNGYEEVNLSPILQARMEYLQSLESEKKGDK